jgi:hypothetical protein
MLGVSVSWSLEGLPGLCTGIDSPLLTGKYVIGVQTVLRNEYSLSYLKNFPFYGTPQFFTMFTAVRVFVSQIKAC